jgi:hypothetical protein
LLASFAIAAILYAIWSAVCLWLASVESWEIPAPIAGVLLFGGGPPLLLWSPSGSASAQYGVMSVTVAVLVAGAALAWRPNVTVSVVLWGAALLAWCSTPVLLLIAWI